MISFLSKKHSIPWHDVFASGIVIFIISVNLTCIPLGLTAIMQDLHISVTTVQWVLNAYIITACMFMILGGQLSDQFNENRIFILSILFWLISFVLSGYASNIYILIFSRAISGLAFALSLPASMIILTNAFSKHQSHWPTSINVTVTGVAQATGPILAGTLLQYLDWHWLFFINIPLTSIALLLALLSSSKQTFANKIKVPIDYTGVVMWLLSLGSLMLVLQCIAKCQVSLPSLCGLVGSIGAMFIFLFNCQRAKKHSFLNFSLLANSSFLLVNILRSLFQFLYLALLFVLPLYLLHVLHLSTIKTGSMMFYIAVSFALTTPFMNRLCHYVKEQHLTTCSFSILLTVFLLAAYYTAFISSRMLVTPFIFIGIAVALMYHCSTSIALSTVSFENKGAASGIFFTNTLIGGALGVAISSLSMRSYGEPSLSTHILEHVFARTMRIGVLVAALGLIISVFQNKITYYFTKLISISDDKHESK